MDGPEVFRHAIARMSQVTLDAVAQAGLALGDIDLFVYHQANARITRALGERLGLPAERVVDCIEGVGNASAATLPVALAAAEADGRLRPGARVLLSAFGAGFTWGGGRRRMGRRGVPELRDHGCALVTGASRGIGAAIARAVAAEGWPVGVGYRSDRAAADAVVAEIEAAGGRALARAGRHRRSGRGRAALLDAGGTLRNARSWCWSTTPGSPPTTSRRHSATTSGNGSSIPI